MASNDYKSDGHALAFALDYDAPQGNERWLRSALQDLEGIRIGFCF